MMKRMLLTLFTVAVVFASVVAQNSVSLQINHSLGEEAFAYDQESANNMDEAFKFTRVQYYISGVVLTHDGGTETAIEDSYILVSANKETLVDLGAHEINSVEAITFSIGVDAAENHNDPAMKPMGHPLAPKNPSMHWGWNAGYRFIAIEGVAGENFGQVFELHGLGDNNYANQTIALDAVATDGEIALELFADYTRIIEDISVSGGVISHEESGAAKKGIENFNEVVFSNGAVTSSVSVIEEQIALEAFPNPVINDVVHVRHNEEGVITAKVLNALGQVEGIYTLQSGALQSINLQTSGVYFIQLEQDGKFIGAEKIINN